MSERDMTQPTTDRLLDRYREASDTVDPAPNPRVRASVLAYADAQAKARTDGDEVAQQSRKRVKAANDGAWRYAAAASLVTAGLAVFVMNQWQSGDAELVTRAENAPTASAASSAPQASGAAPTTATAPAPTPTPSDAVASAGVATAQKESAPSATAQAASASQSNAMRDNVASMSAKAEGAAQPAPIQQGKRSAANEAAAVAEMSSTAAATLPSAKASVSTVTASSAPSSAPANVGIASGSAESAVSTFPSETSGSDSKSRVSPLRKNESSPTENMARAAHPAAVANEPSSIAAGPPPASIARSAERKRAEISAADASFAAAPQAAMAPPPPAPAPMPAAAPAGASGTPPSAAARAAPSVSSESARSMPPSAMRAPVSESAPNQKTASESQAVNAQLRAAVAANDVEGVRNALRNGANANLTLQAGLPVLAAAVKEGRDGIAALLFEAGADPARKDADGLSARDYALRRGNQTLIELFGR